METNRDSVHKYHIIAIGFMWCNKINGITIIYNNVLGTYYINCNGGLRTVHQDIMFAKTLWFCTMLLDYNIIREQYRNTLQGLQQ